MEFSTSFRAMLSDQSALKFLATVDCDDTPNVIPVMSLEDWDECTAVFGERLMYKTKKNLQVCPRVGLLVTDQAGRFASATGNFSGFESHGPILDRINSKTAVPVCHLWHGDFRLAGRMEVDRVWDGYVLERRAWLKGLLNLRLTLIRARNAVAMPLPLFQLVNRLSATKVMAFTDTQGYPRVCPVMPLIAPDRRTLLFSTAYIDGMPLEGQKVAICVLTPDFVAYQIKGIYHPLSRGRAMMEISEVYTACPPLCGEKIAG